MGRVGKMREMGKMRGEPVTPVTPISPMPTSTKSAYRGGIFVPNEKAAPQFTERKEEAAFEVWCEKRPRDVLVTPNAQKTQITR